MTSKVIHMLDILYMKASKKHPDTVHRWRMEMNKALPTIGQLADFYTFIDHLNIDEDEREVS